MPTTKSKSRSLFCLYLAYFADYFIWGVVITFLAIYVGTDQSPFTHLYNWDRQVALGICIACFPIGEVIGSPILGDLSDLIGRRKVLLWGLIGSIFSLGLCAISLWNGWFLLFLAGQLLTGFFSGKQSMAQAAIAEIDTGTKAQKLAFLSVLGGIAWIAGPYLGGYLLEEPFVALGGYIWPSILGCGIFVLTLLCTYFFFEDLYEPQTNKVPLTKFIRGIGNLFSVTFRERVFFLFLMNLLGWYLVIVSISYFLIQKFDLSHSEVGIFNSYVALCFTFGGILGTTWVLHRYRAKKILFWMQILGAFGLFSLFGSEKVAELWIYLAIPAITEALIYPAYQTMLSDQTHEKTQGKMFGLINAVNGVCQILAAWILAEIPTDYIGGSILVSGVLFLCSAAFIPLILRKKAQNPIAVATTFQSTDPSRMPTAQS
jgi:MFS family permease